MPTTTEQLEPGDNFATGRRFPTQLDRPTAGGVPSSASRCGSTASTRVRGRHRLMLRPRRRRWSPAGRGIGSGGCCVAGVAGTQGDGRGGRHGQRFVPR